MAARFNAVAVAPREQARQFAELQRGLHNHLLYLEDRQNLGAPNPPLENYESLNDQPDAPRQPAAGPGEIAQARLPAQRDFWPQRVFTMFFVVFCIILGMRLMVLPWSPDWTANHLLDYYPPLRNLLGLDMVRGAVSGVGLIDVWLGFNTAINYRENG